MKKFSRIFFVFIGVGLLLALSLFVISLRQRSVPMTNKTFDLDWPSDVVVSPTRELGRSERSAMNITSNIQIFDVCSQSRLDESPVGFPCATVLVGQGMSPDETARLKEASFNERNRTVDLCLDGGGCWETYILTEGMFPTAAYFFESDERVFSVHTPVEIDDESVLGGKSILSVLMKLVNKDDKQSVDQHIISSQTFSDSEQIPMDFPDQPGKIVAHLVSPDQSVRVQDMVADDGSRMLVIEKSGKNFRVPNSILLGATPNWKNLVLLTHTTHQVMDVVIFSLGEMSISANLTNNSLHRRERGYIHGPQTQMKNSGLVISDEYVEWNAPRLGRQHFEIPNE